MAMTCMYLPPPQHTGWPAAWRWEAAWRALAPQLEVSRERKALSRRRGARVDPEAGQADDVDVNPSAVERVPEAVQLAAIELNAED